MEHPHTELETKQLGSTAEWSGSTVRTGEGVASRWARNDNDQLIRRAISWVMICASANATACASQTLRMYRKKSGKKGTRSIGRKRLAHLRSPAVGTKAFQYAEYAGDVDEVKEHPALSLLRSPSPWYRGNDFFQLLHLWRELCGNSFVGVVDADTEPSALLPLMPQYTRIQPDQSEFVKGYWYGRATERTIWLEASEVIHAKHMPSPFDPYNGVGPLFAAIGHADLDSAITTDETARWLNGARPDFLAKLPKGTSEDQANAFKSRINANHRGPQNAGKFLVVTEAEIEPLSWNMQEMAYIASRENNQAVIWAAFGVPESRLKMNDANLASSLTGDRQYMRDTITPRIANDAETWTETLLPMFGVKPGEMWFAYDNCVPDDETATATRNVALVNAGIITPNEARIDDGRETFDDEEADKLRGQQVATPYSENPSETKLDETPSDVAKNPAADVQATALNGAQVTALIDLLSQAAAQQIPLESLEPIIEAAFPLLDTELISRIVQPLYGFEPKVEEPTIQANDQIGEITKRLEAIEKKAIEEAEVPSEDAVAALMRRASLFFAFINPLLVDGVSRGLTPAEVMLQAGFESSLVQYLAPELEKQFGTGYRFGQAEAEEYIGNLSEATRGTITPSFDLASPDAQRFLSTYTIRLARTVSATTEESLRSTIAEGLQEGSSIADLAQRVQSVLEERTTMEAERIARTEASRAYNRGREASWRSSGVVSGKEWILSGNPCPICVAMSERFNAANAVDLDKPFIPIGGTLQLAEGRTFTATYEDVYGPPVHPNCACGMAARFSV